MRWVSRGEVEKRRGVVVVVVVVDEEGSWALMRLRERDAICAGCRSIVDQ